MDDYTVKSVDKAFWLLEVVSDHPDGIAITELANRVGMYKSTVHRLLSTMMRRGYIEQDPKTGRYKLGYTVLDLGMKLLSSIDLRREALPYLQELAHLSNEVVHLALLDRGEVVYIDKVESANTIRMHSRVGTRVPVHATGLGKAILAFLPRREAQAIIDRYGLPKLTEHTITNRDAFLQSLQETRRTGYAFDIEEHQAGVCCVAAPVFEHSGRVVAACSVSGPSIRMGPDRLRELVPLVKEAGLRISERLGYADGAARARG
ncbi:MAG: IclR family transcriptional regulator [Alicyclobacillus macrosporangiidus]|uniref:IclR family transcriptional regulator n=1 Tax=Alicyclobacillus macrosporangiidus TaxID=392015 RepID=UPI0026ECF7FE|nr:IclR family transcriptional regulator [Alicyclobacillus macrosporangiidus]MCL6598692.1 IclR family transcriptional regulator [Alicyclobacillus macrosporangiidus]